MGIELRIWSHDSPFGGRNLPATMDKNSLGAHERYSVGQRTHDVYLESKNCLERLKTTAAIQLLRARIPGRSRKALADLTLFRAPDGECLLGVHPVDLR